MEFNKLLLKEEFSINELVSLHYFEFAKDFVFEGERHPFWEFLYVDKGEAEVMAEDANFKLKQGEIIFHKPNEFHNVWANKKIAPNLMVLSFVCWSDSMRFFENKIFSLGDAERGILLQLLKEGMQAFEPPFDQPHINALKANSIPQFGSEQLVKIHLQLLLISVRRNHADVKRIAPLSNPVKENSQADIVRRIDVFLMNNIGKSITLNELCSYTGISRTHLETLFKQRMGMGVIEYFKQLKINHAKTLIREGNYNITEISELLGYSNVHNFSRNFKANVGVSPLHYARTIKIRL